MEVTGIQNTYLYLNDAIKHTKYKTLVDPLTGKEILDIQSWTTQVYDRHARIQELYKSHVDLHV